MKTGIAYNAFFQDFKHYFTDLEIVNPEKLPEYDLIIFSGGEDVGPMRYGQQNSYSSVNARRDEIEFNLISNISAYNKNSYKKIKVLGVCRGLQLISVFLGATLYQDLYFDLSKPHEYHHNLEIVEENSITKMFPNGVNSLHHQGVVPTSIRGLKIIAMYDGVPEILQSDNSLLVQFHPEFMRHDEFFHYVTNWATPKERAKSSEEEPKTSKRRSRIVKSTTETTTSSSLSNSYYINFH